eukprot:6192451-Pleurochrysis_carterae.AAC.10
MMNKQYARIDSPSYSLCAPWYVRVSVCLCARSVSRRICCSWPRSPRPVRRGGGGVEGAVHGGGGGGVD